MSARPSSHPTDPHVGTLTSENPVYPLNKEHTCMHTRQPPSSHQQSPHCATRLFSLLTQRKSLVLHRLTNLAVHMIWHRKRGNKQAATCAGYMCRSCAPTTCPPPYKSSTEETNTEPSCPTLFQFQLGDEKCIRVEENWLVQGTRNLPTSTYYSLAVPVSAHAST